MPDRRVASSVRLEFKAGSLVHTELSGAACDGEWLWVTGDEACGVSLLRQADPVGRETLRYCEQNFFPLADLLDLPGAADDEADLEGMALAEGCLWVVGSHGAKRKKVDPRRDHADNAKRLASLTVDRNRRLLACLPIEADSDGHPRLVREASDGRVALRLKGDAKSNPMTEALAYDPHIGPFLQIPGKDNGFDIEGLAVLGNRLLLGLRGPVLRGWSALLEIAVEPHKGSLRLARLDDSGARLRKHFLQLDGLGVRDLHFSGDDLYILAGPTMVLDGDIRLYKWPAARQALVDNQEPVRFQMTLDKSVALPHGQGTDRAEAICDLPTELVGGRPAWLVLYDALSDARREGEHTVYADLLRRE